MYYQFELARAVHSEDIENLKTDLESKLEGLGQIEITGREAPRRRQTGRQSLGTDAARVNRAEGMLVCVFVPKHISTIRRPGSPHQAMLGFSPTINAAAT
jgi:hypothetical protein